MATNLIQPVVVGVDGSPASLAALRFAGAEATTRDRTLRIVYAVREPDHGLRLTCGAERVVTEAIAHAEAEFPGLAVDAHAVFGGPAAVLLDESDHAALLVVGSRGRGGFVGLLAGSTSTQVATHARGPVVVVRGTNASPGAPVLLGVDPADPADPAIEFAFDEAALHAVALRAFFGWSSANVAGPYHDAAREADRQLNEALASCREKYPDVPVERVAEHTLDPPNALVRASRDAALTVIGSHRRGELHNLLLGSCGYQLLHRAQSPLAVVP